MDGTELLLMGIMSALVGWHIGSSVAIEEYTAGFLLGITWFALVAVIVF